MTKVFHPYHMVMVSPWPLMMGGFVFFMMVGLVKSFVFFDFSLAVGSLGFVGIVSAVWWRDVVRESAFQGLHSSVVVSGLMLGMLLFIVSEVFFFVSFFWAFFHSSLNPGMELGGSWPPSGVSPLNAFQVPLLNTVILLASGVAITWAHQSILNENFGGAVSSLMVTWLLGGYFLGLQWFEYFMAEFSMPDAVFGSTFFMATGFHGFHVMVGTFFLLVMWARLLSRQFSMGHHLGFEVAAWYWHFVDVVWLFLFSVVYWWGV